MTAREANRLRKQGEKQAARLEGRLRRQYTDVLRRSAKQTVAAYRRKSEVIVAAGDDEHKVTPTVDEVFNASGLAVAATTATRLTRQRIALAAGGPLLRETLDQAGQRAFYQPFLDMQAGRQAERIVAGSRETVAAVIGDSVTEGWSVPETADRLNEVLRLDAAWRGTMLARTDLVSISNAATHDAAASLEDGPQFKTWLTAGDDRVRETHQDADGQTVGIEEQYEVGDGELMYPGDPDGPDEETINCRCVSVFSDGGSESADEA